MPTAGYIFRFHTGEVIEVHVGANPRYRHQLAVEIGVPEAGSRPVARVPRGEPVEVTAGVANGTLTVIAGRESRAIPIGARRVVALEASCQSGRFELELQSPPSN